MKHAVLFALVFGLLAGCDCGSSHRRDDGGTDAGPTPDGGPGPDVGPPEMDAGPVDAGPVDPPEVTCEDAIAASSAQGCEHWVVDLDNAAIAMGRDAAGQPFGVVVANPGPSTAEVTIERNVAPVGSTPEIVVVMMQTVAPADAIVFTPGQFSVDGSSPGGINDGTHTALTANALRLRSTAPVTVHQLNPVADVGVFSNDGTLVLPAHALGNRYTIAAWPQTIADGDGDPDFDFDLSSDDEDLRAFLTIVGVEAGTNVEVTLGPNVRRVLGAGPIPEGGPGDVVRITLGAFEVLNLETQAFNADFTGSLVTSTRPVAVFVGSEASDVPMFETYATRSCCGDHLEAQLPPDDRAGRSFVIGRTPSRTATLVDAGAVDVSQVPPQDVVRIVAIEPGMTTVTTSLPAPRDRFVLSERAWVDIDADADFLIEADRALSVLQLMVSQEAAGVPIAYPGGDPSMFVVPAVEHHRATIAFAIPLYYAYDSLVVTAPPGARLWLDGEPFGDDCERTTVTEAWEILRCAINVTPISGMTPMGEDSSTDGFRLLTSDRRVSAVVTGFDSFVSYAFAAGIKLPPR